MPGVRDVFAAAETDGRRFVIIGICYTVGRAKRRVPQFRINASIYEGTELVLVVGPGRNFRTPEGQDVSDVYATRVVPGGVLEALLLHAMFEAADMPRKTQELIRRKTGGSE